jgi:Rad3-related DNA helicase
MGLDFVPTSPVDLGLLPKFGEWRPPQRLSINRSIESTKRFVAHMMPAGGGKTASYVAESLLTGERTVILTSSKGLQDQITKDFSNVGMVDIRGKDNYQCIDRADHSCQDGYACLCPYRGTPMCDSHVAHVRMMASHLIVTNYSKWISAYKYGIGFGAVDRLVLDEAHNAFNEIADAMQVRISINEVVNLLGERFPTKQQAQVKENWRIWAMLLRRKCIKAHRDLDAKIKSAGRGVKTTWIREYYHIKNLSRKLMTIGLMKVNEWVIQEQEWGWQFDPIGISKYAERVLFVGVPNISLYSATIIPRTIDMIGVSPSDYEFYNYESDFRPDWSPVYIVPCQRIDWKQDNRRKWHITIDNIVRRRMKWKGIIHTVSYANRDDILRNCETRDVMISNFGDETVDELVARFRKSKAPCVMVTPAAMTGYDFAGDESRFQIVAKVPFIDQRDLVTMERSKMDPEYGHYHTMLRLAQGSSRSTRSREDWSETFIIDDHIRWFIRPKERGGFRHLAPKWFLDRIKYVDSIPAPMER